MSKLLYGKRWPEDFRSRFFIGMHTVDRDQNATIPLMLGRMNGREIVRQLADAGVDTIYFYMSCHCGNCFYPTAIPPGHMHSGLKGRDVFGEAADECQKRKVAFMGVYEFMHLRLHGAGPREWHHYYPEAGPRTKGKLCWNTGYGEFVKKQVEEVARRYPMAGMYIDMLDHPGLVCCEGCARRFKADIGVPPPRLRDLTSPLYQVFRLWTYRDEGRYLRELRAILQQYQPEATIINNTHLLQCEDLYDTTDANDYLSHDPGIGFGSGLGTVRLSALMSTFRALSRGKYPFEILHDPILLGCVSVIPPAPYEAVTAMSTAQGAAGGYPSSMIDQNGKLNPPVLALTRQANHFTKARRPWQAEGEPVRFAGLYLSQESELFCGQSSAAGEGFHPKSKYTDEFYGAYQMLQEEHLPTDILTRRDLKRLGEYPVVYLPNAVCLSDAEIQAFREYVRRGGTLVASYRSSLADEWNAPRPDFGLGDVFGVHYEDRKLEPMFALQLLLPKNGFPTESWENRNISMPQAALICTLRKGARTLVPLHDRYRMDPKSRYGCLHNCYTREKPAGPAVVANRYGRGRCIYFAGKIFSAYLHSANPSLRKLAARWVIAPERQKQLLVHLQGPSSVEMTAWAQADRNRILVHLVNYQSVPGRVHMPMTDLPVTEDVLPVHDVVLETGLPHKAVQSARLQPAGRRLPLSACKGKAVIKIPRLEIHDIVELVLKPGACPQYPDSNRVFDYPRPDLRERVRQWLATHPKNYDPKDNGVISFDRWRPAEEYLTNWNVVGPFSCEPGRGWNTVFEPERNAALDAVYRGAEGAELRWQEFSILEQHQNGCEMAYRIGNERCTVGYMLTHLRSARAQRVKFWIGNNDACKVFVNGKEVYARSAEAPLRGTCADQDLFEVDLKEGDNSLLVKVEQIGHGLCFWLRLEDLQADVICSAGPNDPGRKAGSQSVKGPAWSGRGEMQV